VAEIGDPAQDVGQFRRRERSHGAGKGGVARREMPPTTLSTAIMGGRPIATASIKRSSEASCCYAIPAQDLSAPDRQSNLWRDAQGLTLSCRGSQNRLVL
jgi:hypothetical protein